MPEAASKPAPPAEFKPHLFGRFFLLQRLAIGGMAEIFRARVQGAAGFEKELVVKRILPARAQDQGFINMLVNEAKLTVQLTHNNIAQIYECGKFDEKYFISMELVNGVTLKELLAAFARAGAVLSPEQAIFIVLQLLQGLDYAHKKTDPQGAPLRIVHCDVSPDNALVSWEGEVKLLDFGIARAATGLSNYKEGMLMGKLGYVAPEQASLEKAWDHRVDVFASGIILYELLTKQRPFPKATDVESLIASRKTKVPPATAVDSRLPKEIDPILTRALAYDPDDRYPEARSFAEALVDVLFPTPQSGIQDLLSKQMQQVFEERIARQRGARAHDTLVMKVLQHNVSRREGGEEKLPDPDAQPQLAERPSDPTPADLQRSIHPHSDQRPRTRTVRVGVPLSRAVLIALVIGAILGGAFILVEIYFRPGVLLVTSQPSGAEVLLDGDRIGTTPVALENVLLWRPHKLQVTSGDFRPVSAELQPALGHLVRRVHLDLESRVGPITVDSDPPGATVRFDDRAMGRTPLIVQGIRLDDYHRVDLTLPGHEPDQFVFLPTKDGVRFVRKLMRRKVP